jgi:hypothetical protein
MNDIVRPDFDEMPIGKLREYAKHMQIPLAKTADKEEIKEAIKRKLSGRTSAVIADRGAKVPPGHAKIIINEDPTPGSKNFPVYFNINGYQCTIPRGKEVIVPMRIIRALNDAKVKRRTQTAIPDNFGREVFRETTVTVPSYPYQLIEATPGPEPLTNHEKQKQKTNGPRARYALMFGRYPRPADLRRAIEKGLITIGDEEYAPEASVDMLEDTED